jgi:hypothetical protein
MLVYWAGECSDGAMKGADCPMMARSHSFDTVDGSSERLCLTTSQRYIACDPLFCATNNKCVRYILHKVL